MNSVTAKQTGADIVASWSREMLEGVAFLRSPKSSENLALLLHQRHHAGVGEFSLSRYLPTARWNSPKTVMRRVDSRHRK